MDRQILPGNAWRVLGGGFLVGLVSTCASTQPPPPASAVTAVETATPSAPGLPSRPEPVVSQELLQRAIQRMVAPEVGGTPLKILAMAGPVRGWLAVAVSPPYREFPTLVLFRTGENGSWSRVFEALTPGVQPQRSGLLDLHTKGQAFDYSIGAGSQLAPDTIAKAISASRDKGLATVAHAYFFHGHPAGAENYFVDRTATYELARRLFPGQYDSYPRTECTMFDVPAIRRIDLGSAGDRLMLTAATDNGQTWVIGWNGVDDRGLLTGKTVEAK